MPETYPKRIQMTQALLGLPFDKAHISDYWSHPFESNPPETEDAMDTNNNPDSLGEKTLIRLSNNCLDCNYKTKRQRLAENNLKDKLNIKSVMLMPRVLPVVAKLELLSSVLNLSDFNLTMQLGKGSFGTVFAADFIEKQRQVPRKVAIKIIQTNTNKKYKEQLFNSFLAELNGRGLKHANIVTQYGFNECDYLTKNAFILYELCGTLNLKQFLIDQDRVLTINKRKQMSLDLIKAIEYIHLHNIVHMDIKPANIIVTNSLILKLTDFGCSIRLNKSSLYDNKNDEQTMNLNQYEDNRWTAGTWYYRAPELFRGDKTFFERNNELVTFKCDIYSLGIVMWQLLTRESPYDEYHEDPQVVVYQIVSKNLRPQFHVNNNIVIKDIQLSPLTSSQSTISMSPMQDINNTILTRTNCSSRVYPEILAQSRSASSLNSKLVINQKKPADNSEFERVFRNLIELSWSNDPEKRYEAKTLREILSNTKISY